MKRSLPLLLPLDNLDCLSQMRAWPLAARLPYKHHAFLNIFLEFTGDCGNRFPPCRSILDEDLSCFFLVLLAGLAPKTPSHLSSLTFPPQTRGKPGSGVLAPLRNPRRRSEPALIDRWRSRKVQPMGLMYLDMSVCDSCLWARWHFTIWPDERPRR